MAALDATSLQSELALKQRMLDCVLAIDRIRDEASDERALVAASVGVMCGATHAEACLLSLNNEDTGELELRAISDRLGVFDRGDEVTLRNLAGRALALEVPASLQPETALADVPHWLGAPLRVRNQQLGAVLLAHRSRPFDEADQQLLVVAAGQLDSGVAHMRALNLARRERLELATIYAVDHIRDRQLPFDEMLNTVLAELGRAIPSEAGFIMLFDRVGQQLELKATTDHDLFRIGEEHRRVYDAARDSVQQAELVHRAYSDGRIHSLIGVPLILNNEIIGVFGVVNRAERADFTDADRQLLSAITSQMDTAIFEGLQIQRYRDVFGRRVGPQVMERLLRVSDRDLLRGERALVTTLFSDIRGFTAISDRVDPDILVTMLNQHLSAMTEIVLTHEGLVDKFVGDCVMALYNVPEPQPDHALRAVQTALAMMRTQRELMKQWQSKGWEAAPIGIGIDTGETIVGNFGSERRNEYTAISSSVNLAARLCGAAAGDQILISEGTYALIRDYVVTQPLAALHLKGFDEPAPVWQVLGSK
jgi:class 3 adenylate cyclase